MSFPPALLDRLTAECIRMGLSNEEAKKYIFKAIPQSELFMTEVIPHIHANYLDLPENVLKTVLDVGPQSFGGTSLLSRLHSKYSFNRLKLSVSAIDIHSKFSGFCSILSPEVNFVCGNIYDLAPNSFDFCIASHVIEHVDNPVGFVERLANISRDFVIIAAPWMESQPLTKGHINIIDKSFVDSVGGTGLEVKVNYSWGKNRKVCIFTVRSRNL